MKKIIILLISLIMVSSVYATVSRDVSGDTITYTTNMATTYPKAYWAIEESYLGCTITGVSCSVTNGDCSYYLGTIRAVGYTAEAGGSMPSSIAITVIGTGNCALTGQYVESYNTGSQAVVMDTPSGMGSSSINLDASCNTDADTNCDSTVSDSELLAYANLWLGGSIGDTELLQAASAWLGG